MSKTTVLRRGLGKATLVLGAGVLATAGFATPAGAAATSVSDTGGGCAAGSEQNGFRYDVCVSTGSGRVYSDTYLKSTGWQGSDCNVRITLTSNNGDVVSNNGTCSNTHLINLSAAKQSGRWYQSFIVVTVNGSVVNYSYSPVQYT
ncbi:hypothetical protein [Kitasatospora sp. NPDC059327]|uniref:hypothetical protein n=1 Tax=Kitasatospora sp. NPDC059327 TaxID=3346803 RepID=UPI003696C232